MSEQPTALRLADDLESTTRGYPPVMMAASELRRLHAVNQELLEALRDMLSGWIYIRQMHNDLYGVGWDRAQGKAEAALAKAEGQA